MTPKRLSNNNHAALQGQHVGTAHPTLLTTVTFIFGRFLSCEGR